MKLEPQNFYMSPEDKEWLREKKAEADRNERGGKVSLSRVIADLIEFARVNSYIYRSR
jgi:LPS sulfotransferase NodH